MTAPVLRRIVDAFTASFPKAVRIAWWMIRLTFLVSLGVEVLRYLGVIAWLSVALSPVFSLIGLPGEAALAFITGYFVNVYSAIAVIDTLSLSWREVTILGAMVLCAHNMVIEGAVQRKTGSSAIRMVVVRTLGALLCSWLLHWLLPAGGAAEGVVPAAMPVVRPLQEVVVSWLWSIAGLVLRMLVFIVGLSFLQRLLAEFGVIRWLSKALRPLLRVFGLPARTSFLWIVANILGLAYGAAVMIEETEEGKIDRRDADLLNHHISVSHSNLEDLLLMVSQGGLWGWLLLSRWALSLLFVWARRLELYFLGK